jgi:hypothetical protein
MERDPPGREEVEVDVLMEVETWWRVGELMLF